jgi:hypothetical protein
MMVVRVSDQRDKELYFGASSVYKYYRDGRNLLG